MFAIGTIAMAFATQLTHHIVTLILSVVEWSTPNGRYEFR